MIFCITADEQNKVIYSKIDYINGRLICAGLHFHRLKPVFSRYLLFHKTFWVLISSSVVRDLQDQISSQSQH